MHAASAPAYVCIFSFFSTFSQSWTKLSKIEISLFGFPSFIFFIDFNNLKKNLCDFGHNWKQIQGFWAKLGKFEKNWWAFG